MSGIYFHTPSKQAELRGSERAWLRQVARGPADAAWDLNGSSGFDRAKAILDLVPEVPDGLDGANYLHTMLRAAVQNKDNPEPRWALVRALKTTMRVDGLRMLIAGVELNTDNISLNTALVAGSDPVRLAAKINGWCESHAWVDGPDRAWMADIINEGLRAGIYRRELWYADTSDGPHDKRADQGWGQVVDLLRARDDEPVVMSYSVTDGFPNPWIAGWDPPIDPGWLPDWADGDGHNEWIAMSGAERAGWRREHADEQWYDLPADQQWELAMAGLRRERPWARIGPDTLAEVTFHYPVTVYDLFAPDRDERVRAAALEGEA